MLRVYTPGQHGSITKQAACLRGVGTDMRSGKLRNVSGVCSEFAVILKLCRVCKGLTQAQEEEMSSVNETAMAYPTILYQPDSTWDVPDKTLLTLETHGTSSRLLKKLCIYLHILTCMAAHILRTCFNRCFSRRRTTRSVESRRSSGATSGVRAGESSLHLHPYTLPPLQHLRALSKLVSRSKTCVEDSVDAWHTIECLSCT